MNTNTKILIVEDESIVALEIRNILQDLGYIITDTVVNYDDALKSVKNNKPDIVFMDIFLHNSKDGIETATAIKQMYDIPIVYLSAYCDDDTITRATATEPAAYLVKPFKREDLKTTINIVTFKMNKLVDVEINENLTRLSSDYYFDEKLQILYYQNHPIKVSKHERKFISYMLQSKGVIVPFKVLEDYIWEGNSVSDSSLRTLVYRLRAKLNYMAIETVHAVGFKLSFK